MCYPQWNNKQAPKLTITEIAAAVKQENIASMATADELLQKPKPKTTTSKKKKKNEGRN